MGSVSPMRKPKQEAEAAPVIIVKKIVDDHGDHGHHGGAWKVAYADFATAMMAFFMLLWIVGATTEKQRKGIADYFSPTLVKVQSKSSGSNGLLDGRSLTQDPGGAPASSSGNKGSLSSMLLEETSGKRASGLNIPDAQKRIISAELDRKAFKEVEKALDQRLLSDASLADLRQQVRYVETREGLRIEILDRAGFSMFGLGTDRLEDRAAKLMVEVARTVKDLPNPIAIRGHTDSLQYADKAMNNWKLSVYRAEATRSVFANQGIPAERFARLEGVADREPFVSEDPADPRNRRISVTLFYRDR